MFERKELHCHGLVTSNKPVLPGGCNHTGTLSPALHIPCKDVNRMISNNRLIV